MSSLDQAAHAQTRVATHQRSSILPRRRLLVFGQSSYSRHFGQSSYIRPITPLFGQSSYIRTGKSPPVQLYSWPVQLFTRSDTTEALTRVLLRLRQQPARDGVDGSLRAVTRAELLEEEREVVLDRALRQVKFVGDLLVALAVDQHP